MNEKSSYPLGSSRQEQQRLEKQIQFQGSIDFIPLHLMPQKARILEVGCGSGTVLRLLAEKLPQADLHGLDMQPDHINFAKTYQFHDRINYQLGNAETLPFPDNSFDLVFCRLVLCWIPNPIKAVAEMVRVAKKSGVVAAEEGNVRSLLFFPARPHFEKCCRLLYENGALLGMNPVIGCELPELFLKSQLSEINYHPKLIWGDSIEKKRRDFYINNWFLVFGKMTLGLVKKDLLS